MKISRFNKEGYPDPTTYQALTNIEKERKAKAAEARREHDRRCWECTRCNNCKSAFKMTTLCENYNQRKRRMSKNA